MKIDKKYLEEIIKHCQKEYPKEACGILAGKIVQRSAKSVERIVSKVYRMKNISESPQTCYFMEPSEQFKVFKEMRKQNLELVSIYHSHTNTNAYPSKRDCDMAFYPEAIYIIISCSFNVQQKAFNEPEVRGFKIIEGEIKEEKINIE